MGGRDFFITSPGTQPEFGLAEYSRAVSLIVTGDFGGTTLTLEYQLADDTWVQYPGISIDAENGVTFDSPRRPIRIIATGGSGIDLTITANVFSN